MILQVDKYSCGATALVNVMRAIGNPIPLQVAVRLAGTNPIHGTTDSGVRRAIRDLGFRPLNIEVVNSGATAVATLRGHLVAGEPALLAVDRDEHWVAAVGVLGDRIVVVDSADGNLTVVLSPRELTRRWRSRQDEHTLYTGVVVTGV